MVSTAPSMEQRMDATLSMQPLPVLIAFSQMLALPASELEMRIEHELAENPALERDDPAPCAACGVTDAAQHAADCELGFASGDHMLVGVQLAEPGMLPEPDQRATPEAALRADAQLALAGTDRALAAYTIASLDDAGFLPGGVECIAAELGESTDRIQRVLEVLRQVGPPAIGARDLRESLLLQLAAMANVDERVRGHALAIANCCLDAVAAGRHSSIASALGVTRADVVAALAFMRKHLSPRPASGFRQPRGSAPRLVPDIVVRTDPSRPGEFSVHAIRPTWSRLRVDPSWSRLTRLAPGDDRLRRLVQEARSFVARVNERATALERIARIAVERQKGYLRFGPRFLQPLTRAEVAAEVGLHESTLSRATAGKAVQLPSGRIVPFADFFDVSRVLEDVLRELLEQEQGTASDRELADELRALGYPVARRTVTKYRQRLGIPPAAARAGTRALSGERAFA